MCFVILKANYDKTQDNNFFCNEAHWAPCDRKSPTEPIIRESTRHSVAEKLPTELLEITAREYVGLFDGFDIWEMV